MSEKRNSGLISIVAPVYNEKEIISEFVREIFEITDAAHFQGNFEMILVNDGSTDGSEEILDQLVMQRSEEIRVVHLARNFGHEAAVSAGLKAAKGDAVILMDSDLQDDPNAIPEFLAKWQEGFDVVFAQRSSRAENAVLRFLFWGFYKILSLMANFKLPMNAGNFSLLDRKVVDRLNQLEERNRYLPGLRAWIGFKQTGIPVPRRKRYDKSTRVGFRGKWTLAMNAIFSFSYVPIFVFRLLGFLTILLSLFLMIFIPVMKSLNHEHYDIFSSPVIWIAFFAGINLFGISVVGEYVARIYDEVKDRPKYIVDRVSEDKENTESHD